MRSSERRGQSEGVGSLSLVLPLTPGSVLDEATVANLRRRLESTGVYRDVETVVAGSREEMARAHAKALTELAASDRVTLVTTEADDWGERARVGLSVATGEHLMVLDTRRDYGVEAMLGVLEPVATGRSELAVAVPRHCPSDRLVLAPVRKGLGLASRLVLGSSDAFSGLFVLRRSLWERGGRRLSASGSSLVMELLLRRPARCADVAVDVGPDFRRHGFHLQDIRPLKHVLDGRYGSFSRLIQFCCVGASGMVVDLTCYALFQWILAFTPLATTRWERFGVSWHLAVSAALSIAIALLWNFSLNRRLTFNDARGRSWIRQFLTYALSNALGVALSFTLRLYLPAHVAFFAKHRLAAAVVGIVAATGISFTMSRWIVFSRRPERPRAAAAVVGQAKVSSPSALV